MLPMSPVFEMDATPSIPLRSDVPPEFVPSHPGMVPSNGHSPPSHLMSDAPSLFPLKADHPNGTITSMHVLASNQPNLTPANYLDPPEVIDPSAVIHSTSTIADFSPFGSAPPFNNDISVDPIASHVSSHSPEAQMPAHHLPVGLSYTVGSTSSLQSALKPVITPARSRANTVGSFVGDAPRGPTHPPPSADQFPSLAELGTVPTGENPLVAGSALLRESVFYHPSRHALNYPI